MESLDKKVLDKLEKKQNVKNEDIRSAILALIKYCSGISILQEKVTILGQQNEGKNLKFKNWKIESDSSKNPRQL